jgi:hypothetical protein
MSHSICNWLAVFIHWTHSINNHWTLASLCQGLSWISQSVTWVVDRWWPSKWWLTFQNNSIKLFPTSAFKNKSLKKSKMIWKKIKWPAQVLRQFWSLLATFCSDSRFMGPTVGSCPLLNWVFTGCSISDTWSWRIGSFARYWSCACGSDAMADTIHLILQTTCKVGIASALLMGHWGLGHSYVLPAVLEQPSETGAPFSPALPV